ncbi:MAG: hypothetical protein PHS24_04975 [Bacilli bacterium]|nr:hypothetical protein [Bacilli bacterium]MDD4706540.1 hypothetical protein [Bacilli bacterium]
MDYKKLPIILKRYSFDEKMRVLQYYSKQIMDINGIELKDEQPMAWELETFLLFTVKATEYQNKDFKGKNINEFIKIINCIKGFHHPIMSSKVGTFKFADFLLIALGSTQFDLQSFHTYKYYRYNYFFTYVSNNLNMKEEFYNKFNVDYNSFLEFGSILSLFFSLKVNLDSEILKYIVLKYTKTTSLLMISRDEFEKQIDKFSNSIDDYLYCIRPSYIYPFIEYNKTISLPLPHCITRSITDSLLYRLTDSNSKLRTLFGKNVLEDYLFGILNKSSLFDEVIKEKKYKKSHNILQTSDVMCRINDNYIFFESKATVPYAKTRCLDDNFINQEINKIRDAVVQLYKQIHLDFRNIYDFFKNNQEVTFDYNNCYGIVVLLEESYIRRELIYKAVAKKLKINEDSELYIWIINHIKICNLYDIEKYAFSDTDILSALKEQLKNNTPYDYPLSNVKIKSKIKNADVYYFEKKRADNIEKFADELIEVGLLKKE